MPEKSRETRWNDAAETAQEAIATLLDIQSELEDELSDTEEPSYGLKRVCNLDLNEAYDTVREAGATDLSSI